MIRQIYLDAKNIQPQRLRFKLQNVQFYSSLRAIVSQVVGWKQKILNKAENLIRNLPLRAHYLLWGGQKNVACQ